MLTIKEALQTAKTELAYACERPLYEAEILLAYHLGVERIYLVLHECDEVERIDIFEELVARRASHEPMEYITSRVSFYDIELFIARGALIPRPETEILVDEASKVIASHGYTHIAEIGIGSGAISIVLARKFPRLCIEASDISVDALKIAEQNIKNFQLKERIHTRENSLLEGLANPVQMVVSNPPYIAKHTPLSPNVAEYEPHTALYSQEVGDELLKEIIVQTKRLGIKHLACEMGYDQKQSISAFVRDIGVYSIDFYQDFAGLDRGFIIEF